MIIIFSLEMLLSLFPHFQQREICCCCSQVPGLFISDRMYLFGNDGHLSSTEGILD